MRRNFESPSTGGTYADAKEHEARTKAPVLQTPAFPGPPIGMCGENLLSGISTALQNLGHLFLSFSLRKYN